MVKVEKGVERRTASLRYFLKTPQVLAGLAASAITFFFMGVQSILMAPTAARCRLVPGHVGVLSIVVGIPTFAYSIGIPRDAGITPSRHRGRLHRPGRCLATMAFSVTLDSASLPGIVVGCILAGSGAGVSPPRPTTSSPWP
ncbi:MAG: hypothetical protein ACLT98_07765 [Eggerthellaceae bacterium]